MHKSYLGCLAAVLLLSTALNRAEAATITIGLQEAGVNGGAVTTVASGAGIASFTGGYGNFSTTTSSGVGVPNLASPDLLLGNAIDVENSTSAHSTLNVYISETGLASNTALTDFSSAFTSNLLTKGWTVTEKTYMSSADGLYDLSTLLGSAMFSSIGTNGPQLGAGATPGAYSLTELFTINTNGRGDANSTIDVSQTPLPAALPLFGTALAAGLALLRRRRQLSA